MPSSTASMDVSGQSRHSDEDQSMSDASVDTPKNNRRRRSLSSVRDGHRNHKRQHARSASSASDTSSASSSRSRSRSSSRSRSRSRSRERKKSPRRERRRSSRSHSPKIPRVFDVDPVRKRERERQLMQQYNEEEPEKTPPPPVDPAEERIRLAFTTRTGGAYIPPAKLREMQAQITDKSSREYQRLEWERLKKSINGLVNKVNTSNIKAIVPELFKVNLIRGRGLFARSIMKAQAAALPFTPVYAALIAVLNARMPQIGELVLSRLVVQFRRAYKRNDKTICLSSTTFIAHLSNQQVAHEILILQMLALLLERPTDDSVEIAVNIARESGAFLTDASPRAFNAVFERFRAILHEAQIDKRIQYMIEVLFQVRRDKFKDNPAIPEELDIVEDDDRITHTIGLDDDLDVQEGLGVFKFDPDFLENEAKYAQIRAEILGEDSSDEEGDSDESTDESDESEAEVPTQALANQLKIHDRTETNLINLRRTIYLTIMSSVDFEECAHKLMKIQLQEGEEKELCSMIIECCSQERTFFKFYGLLAERFCKLNRVWADAFSQLFGETFETIHRYETNRLRNVARLFAHILAYDGISWSVMSIIKLNEEDTTASSRIFIKILFQEICAAIGLKQLNERLKDPYMAEAFTGIFPIDNPKNTRFAINYFTSIGLGGLTEELREHLKNAPKLIMAQRHLMESSSSDSSDTSDSDSSSTTSTSSASSSGSYSSSSSTYSSDTDTSDTSDSSVSSYRSRSRGRRQSPASRSYRDRSRSRSRGRDARRDRDRGREESPASRLDRNRSRSRSRSRSRIRDVRRDRSRDRGDSPAPKPDRSRSRSRSRIRDVRRDRGRDRDDSPISRLDRNRSLSRSRSRGRDVRRDRDRSRGRDKSPVPSPDRDRSLSRSRSRSRGRDARRDRDRGRGRDDSPIPSPSRNRSFSRSRSRSRVRDIRRDRSPSRSRSRVRDVRRDRSRGRDGSPVRRDRSAIRSPVRRDVRSRRDYMDRRRYSRSRSPTYSRYNGRDRRRSWSRSPRRNKRARSYSSSRSRSRSYERR